MAEGETATKHRPSRAAGISTLPFRESSQRKKECAKAENRAGEAAGPCQGLGRAQPLDAGFQTAARTHHRGWTPLPVVTATDVYTVTRLRSHRPARAASLPIGGPLAAAPHWHRAGVGGANLKNSRRRAGGCALAAWPHWAGSRRERRLAEPAPNRANSLGGRASADSRLTRAGRKGWLQAAGALRMKAADALGTARGPPTDG